MVLARRCSQRVQLSGKFLQRFAAMAAGIFFFVTHLRRTTSHLANEEHRIVTKAAVTPLLCKDAAPPLPLGDDRLLITGHDKTANAVKSCTALRVRNPVESSAVVYRYSLDL